jgi:hypothetical protein
MMETTKNMKKTICAGAAVSLLILLLAWVSRTPHKQVPQELVGEWHTTDPNYADRTLEIDSTCINFTTGGGTVSTGFIKEVKEVPEGSRTLYTISYTVDETPSEVSFYYDPNKRKSIRFKNQEKTVWTKDESS